MLGESSLQQLPSAQPAQSHASTSLNIAIQDQKDFPGDVAAHQELYTELTMVDGRQLFECPSLIKATGIDLMNCPLSVVLKLNIRRRTLQGAIVLWHVVLPLPLISKYLLNPPHEWETWIGLFPSAQSLEAHCPDMMFTQSVHLISRPEFPKLRLRFTYHNPELQAQISAQREAQQQESRRRMEFSQNVGRAQFEEIHKLTRNLRDSSLADRDGGSSVGTTQGDAAAPDRATAPTSNSQVTAAPMGDQDRLTGALLSALRFVGNVHQALANAHLRDPSKPSLPLPLSSDEVLASPVPGDVIEMHCQQLYHCLGAAIPDRCKTDAAVEPMLAEGLRMALMGMLGDSDAAKAPRTSTNLSDSSNDQLSFIQTCYPSLWEAYREVSALAKERADLLGKVSAFTKDHGQQESFKPVDQAADYKKQFERILTQQVQASQSEMGVLRQQLDERDRELGQLRLRLGELTQQQTS